MPSSDGEQLHNATGSVPLKCRFKEGAKPNGHPQLERVSSKEAGVEENYILKGDPVNHEHGTPVGNPVHFHSVPAQHPYYARNTEGLAENPDSLQQRGFEQDKPNMIGAGYPGRHPFPVGNSDQPLQYGHMQRLGPMAFNRQRPPPTFDEDIQDEKGNKGDTNPRHVGSGHGGGQVNPLTGAGNSSGRSNPCTCPTDQPCECGLKMQGSTQRPRHQSSGKHSEADNMHPPQEEMTLQEGPGHTQGSHMKKMQEMYPGYFPGYHSGMQNPMYYPHPYYYQNMRPPVAREEIGHSQQQHLEQKEETDQQQEHDPRLDSDDGQEEEDGQQDEPEDSSASEAGMQSLSRSFGRSRKFRPGTGSVHGNFATKLL